MHTHARTERERASASEREERKRKHAEKSNGTSRERTCAHDFLPLVSRFPAPRIRADVHVCAVLSAARLLWCAGGGREGKGEGGRRRRRKETWAVVAAVKRHLVYMKE